MTDDLNAIPPGRRRQMALALAPVGLVLLLAGVLTVSLDGLGWKLIGLLVAVLAAMLLAVAWGLRRSAALSEASLSEQRLDEVLIAATRSSGAAGGGGGSGPSHEAGGFHDPHDRRDAQDSAGAPCASAGLCGAASAPGGCGGSCLARSR